MQNEYAVSLVQAIEEHFKHLEQTLAQCEKLHEAKASYYQSLNELYSGVDAVKKRKKEYEEQVKAAGEKIVFLQQEIGAVCDGYKTLEPLTISIFGEWGSGKTHILKEIKYHFDEALEKKEKLWDRVYQQNERKTETNAYMIVPVFFNAWRFEKEEHIIIPLFKTLIHTFESYKERYKRAEVVYEKLKLVAFALIGSLQYSAKGVSALLEVFEGDFTHIDALKEFFNLQRFKLPSKEEPTQTLLELIGKEGLESIYLHIPYWVEKITVYDDVRFVFLIDDIDRCLPENALKMLESIKLFLDIPGCSFVLAIDDDVIERGVEHHYKEYRLDGNHKQLPITGSEYLEKIVQLPFRIPSSDSEDAKAFLVQKFEWLRPTSSEERGEERKQKRDETETLLSFFVEAVPQNPRKLIRVATLYRSKTLMLRSQSYDPLLLAHLTVLELLAPRLFRYIKRKGFKRMLERINRLIAEHKSLYEAKAITEDIEKLPPKDRADFTELYGIIQEVLADRVEFDLERVLDTGRFRLDEEALSLHTRFKRFWKQEDVADETLPTSAPKDSETFFERLLSDDALLWQSAFEDDGNLRNALLDDQSANELIRKAQTYFGEKKPIEPRWLEIVGEHLSKRDFAALIKTLNPVKRWKDAP